MTPGDDDLLAALVGELSDSELIEAVVYIAAEPVLAAEVVNMPGVAIHVPWDATLAFVDREPMANWSHSARYVLLSRRTGEAASIEASLPPFGPATAAAGLRWQVARRPPSVPEAILPKLD